MKNPKIYDTSRNEAKVARQKLDTLEPIIKDVKAGKLNLLPWPTYSDFLEQQEINLQMLY